MLAKWFALHLTPISANLAVMTECIKSRGTATFQSRVPRVRDKLGPLRLEMRNLSAGTARFQLRTSEFDPIKWSEKVTQPIVRVLRR